ncbi:MAG: hypothetical protein AAF921_23625 [Cyanobacteria bacterium P01_D01_bin.44]
MQFINSRLNASISITCWVLIFTTVAMFLDCAIAWCDGAKVATKQPLALPPAPVVTLPDLGPELDGEQIIAAISRHIPAAAQAITGPAATLVVVGTDTLQNLRQTACKAFDVDLDTAKGMARAYGHIGRKNTWRELIAACDL